MSNIKKEPKDKKGKLMSLRLTEGERETIEAGAKKYDMSVSGYIVAKATQKGGVRIRKENMRIRRLVMTEQAFVELIGKIKVVCPNKDILDAADKLETEIMGLWRC